MSGTNIVVDTNIAIYLLQGNINVKNLLNNCNVYVSAITQMELLGFFKISNSEKEKINRFLEDCIIVEITPEVRELAIITKQKYKIKLPDAIIAATSIYLDFPLFTADKAFKKISKLNLALYKIH